MGSRVPAYFDGLIEGFLRGATGRFVHLGYWDDREPFGEATSMEEFSRAQSRLDRLLIGMADVREGQKVLDVGCGFGGTLEAINSAMRGVDLTGVNIDPRQLDICRRIAPADGNRLSWKLADACDLPFAPESFDRVLCIEAMFHFDSRRRFFAEAARVLRVGGVLVCSDIVLCDTDLPAPAVALEAPLIDAYGPWPDLWGRDANHAELARAAGMSCSRTLDVTVNTLPSHRFTVPRPADEGRDSGDPLARAALALRWLHREGHLRYLCLRFDKPAAASAS